MMFPANQTLIYGGFSHDFPIFSIFSHDFPIYWGYVDGTDGTSPDFAGLLGPFEAEVPETSFLSRNGSTYPTKKIEKKEQHIFDYSSKPNVYIYKLYIPKKILELTW